MMKEQEVLLKRFKETRDYWLETALKSLEDDSDLSWSNCEQEYHQLKRLISNEETMECYSKVVDELMVGLIHSLLVMFDGGDELTDEFNIDIINADTKASLLENIALHERFFEYLFDVEER